MALLLLLCFRGVIVPLVSRCYGRRAYATSSYAMENQLSPLVPSSRTRSNRRSAMYVAELTSLLPCSDPAPTPLLPRSYPAPTPLRPCSY